jgi:hypothetical protein
MGIAGMKPVAFLEKGEKGNEHEAVRKIERKDLAKRQVFFP